MTYNRNTGEKTWSNVAGELELELYFDENEELYDDKDYEVPSCLLPYVQSRNADYQLVIEFNSSGYDRPAEMSSGPDGLGCPAEGDDERTLDNVVIIFTNSETLEQKPLKVELPKKVQEEVFEHYKDRIDEIEVETGEQ